MIFSIPWRMPFVVNRTASENICMTHEETGPSQSSTPNFNRLEPVFQLDLMSMIPEGQMILDVEAQSEVPNHVGLASIWTTLGAGLNRY